MTRLETCIGIVLNLEGGLSNHKKDKGGLTNFGITQTTYTNWLARFGRSHQSVSEITYDEVKDIYSEYWKDAHCSYMFPPLDLLVFDCAINSGPGRAIKLLQNALGVGADGVVGKQTMAALHEEIAADGIEHMCDAYLDEREAWYLRIVERDPSQKVFLKGWRNRLEHLRELIE